MVTVAIAEFTERKSRGKSMYRQGLSVPENPPVPSGIKPAFPCPTLSSNRPREGVVRRVDFFATRPNLVECFNVPLAGAWALSELVHRLTPTSPSPQKWCANRYGLPPR